MHLQAPNKNVAFKSGPFSKRLGLGRSPGSIPSMTTSASCETFVVKPLGMRPGTTGDEEGWIIWVLPCRLYFLNINIDTSTYFAVLNICYYCFLLMTVVLVDYKVEHFACVMKRPKTQQTWLIWDWQKNKQKHAETNLEVITLYYGSFMAISPDSCLQWTTCGWSLEDDGRRKVLGFILANIVGLELIPKNSAAEQLNQSSLPAVWEVFVRRCHGPTHHLGLRHPSAFADKACHAARKQWLAGEASRTYLGRYNFSGFPPNSLLWVSLLGKKNWPRWSHPWSLCPLWPRLQTLSSLCKRTLCLKNCLGSMLA